MQITGSFRGYIADRKDPEKQGRVLLRVPALWDDQVHDYWAYPKGMFAGDGIGFIAIPEVGDMVWVEFEAGDQRYPVWNYGHWVKGKNLADIYGEDGEPVKVALITKSGHSFIIDDKKNTITLTQKDGIQILLDEEYVNAISKKISLGTKGGSKEPIVLGDTATKLLNAFITDLGNIGAIQTNTGITGLLSTSPGWQALVSKWTTKWEDFNSKVTSSD